MSRHKLVNHYGGWRRSAPENRPPAADTSGITILRQVDPRAAMLKASLNIYNQINLGSCTANATTRYFRWDAILDGRDPGDLSRLWVYWQERNLEGEVGQGDTGAVGFDAFRAASTVGVCAEADWPYDPQQYDVESYFDPSTPPAKATGDEAHYKLAKPYVHVPQTESDLKAALSNGQLVCFGFTVYDSFEGASVASAGVVPVPASSENVLGGHEIELVGYLEDESTLPPETVSAISEAGLAVTDYALIANSWDVTWGLAGYALMPWSMILDAKNAGDHATIVRAIA